MRVVRDRGKRDLFQEVVLSIGVPNHPERAVEGSDRPPAIHHFWDEAFVTPNGELHVEGWAVCPTGIDQVAVHLDGDRLGEAVLGLARPDVGRHYNTVAMARVAGFRFRRGLAGVPAGPHEVRLVIRNGAGEERSAVKPLQVFGVAASPSPEPSPVGGQDPEFHFHVDSPRIAHGAAVDPVVGSLTIEGWALSRSGIAGIEVLLDDASLGDAQCGLAREDVGAAYPEWDGAAHSGFMFRVPPDALGRGQHVVTLVVRSMDGRRVFEHVRLDVKGPDDVTDLLGIRRQSGDGASRFEQVLPTLLPIVVDQTYRTVLHRAADPAGLGQHVELLKSGKSDLRGLVDAVYGCPEYRTIVGPATEEVRTAYRFLFEREPTQGEVSDHVRAFRDTCVSDDEAASLLRKTGDARPRLGIRPLKIEMDVTNQCNIRCIMCPFSDPAIGGRKRSDLSQETFARWSDEMFSWANYLGLMFGTEPTLNKNLVSFVRIAKEFRVPHVYFSTNAMKLTPALTEALIDAGLDEFNVSLDGGTKATFERIRRGAKWDTVLSNLRSLRDQKTARNLSRPRLHMSYVLMRSNIHELPQFVELAAELGAVVLYFTHLVSYDTLGTTGESLGTNLDDFEHYLERASSLARQHDIHVVLPRVRQSRVDLSLARGTDGVPQLNHLAHIDQAREAHGLPRRFARDEANSCCPFPWHFIAIEPDGSVRPCGWWHAGPPMGNLHTQSFQEIWSGEPRRTLRRQLVTRRLGTNCTRCPAAGMGSSDSPESFQSR